MGGIGHAEFITALFYLLDTISCFLPIFYVHSFIAILLLLSSQNHLQTSDSDTISFNNTNQSITQTYILLHHIILIALLVVNIISCMLLTTVAESII